MKRKAKEEKEARKKQKLENITAFARSLSPLVPISSEYRSIPSEKQVAALNSINDLTEWTPQTVLKMYQDKKCNQTEYRLLQTSLFFHIFQEKTVSTYQWLYRYLFITKEDPILEELNPISIAPMYCVFDADTLIQQWDLSGNHVLFREYDPDGGKLILRGKTGSTKGELIDGWPTHILDRLRQDFRYTDIYWGSLSTNESAIETYPIFFTKRLVEYVETLHGVGIELLYSYLDSLVLKYGMKKVKEIISTVISTSGKETILTCFLLGKKVCPFRNYSSCIVYKKI